MGTAFYSGNRGTLFSGCGTHCSVASTCRSPERSYRILRSVSGTSASLCALAWYFNARRRRDSTGSFSCAIPTFAPTEESSQPSGMDFPRSAQSRFEKAYGEPSFAGSCRVAPGTCRAASRPFAQSRGPGLFRATSSAAASGFRCPSGIGPELPSTSRRRASLSRDRRSAGDFAGQRFAFVDAVVGAPDSRRPGMICDQNISIHPNRI